MTTRLGRWRLPALLLLAAVSVEATSWAVFRLASGRTPSEVRDWLVRTAGEGPGEELARLEGLEAEQGWIRQKMLHPYLGFVGLPGSRAPGLGWVNEFGFHGRPAPWRREPDRPVIAITGGSVAMGFFFDAMRGDAFRRQLQRHPAFAEREIRFVSFAIDGMKQPQQLLALNYFLSLGQKIDYLINLDGFNEVVLPYVENYQNGVFPFYPRAWKWHAAKAVELDSAVLLGWIADSRSRRLRWQRRLAGTPLRYSTFCLLVWDLLDRRQEARERLWEERLSARHEIERQNSPQVSGPAYQAASLEDVIRDSVSVWKRSSIQMWQLASANGIRYLHALQPNQYLAGSKPLTAEEQRTAIAPPGAGYRIAAEPGYPALREAGREIAEAGVPFEDLTDVFEDVTETIYVDSCCHVNALGNRHVGQRIADRLGRLERP